MKRISDILNQQKLNLDRELIKVENCKHCKRELKTYRMQLIGGPQKGSWVTITEECSCYLAEQAVEEAALEKQKFFRKQSTINDSLKQATLDNYSPNNESQIQAVKKAIEFVDKISQNQSARLMYYGEPGLGKSHLAVGISKILEEKFHKTCLFLEVPTLKNLIKSSWSKESDYTELELHTVIRKADLLILDDVGAEGITPWTKELMFTILNSRLSKNLLITTNMHLLDIYREYGPKITDRFLENMEKEDIVNIKGEYSYRLTSFLTK